MFQLAANLSLLFADLPLADRFAAAAEAGFRAVEMQFPYALPPGALAALLARHDLTLALFNAPAGDLATGERGLAIEDGARFEASIAQALDYAAATGCSRVHVMIGNAGATPPDHDALAGTLRTAARRFAEASVSLLLEPLNRRDQPDYALCSLETAEMLRSMIGEPNVHLQFDAYHAAMRGEDAVAQLARYLPHSAHIQIADPGDRGEPTGAAMQAFLAALETSGYGGHVGCEYVPRGDTRAGLAWARRYGID